MQFPAEVILLVLGILGLILSTASLVAGVLAADRSKRVPDIEKATAEGFAQVNAAVAELKTSLEGMETLMTDFISELLSEQAPHAIFRSLDGKHEATSLEELIEKMATDPNGPKLTQEEIDKLRDFFQNATDETDFEVDLDEEDDDEGEEGWKKGK